MSSLALEEKNCQVGRWETSPQCNFMTSSSYGFVDELQDAPWGIDCPLNKEEMPVFRTLPKSLAQQHLSTINRFSARRFLSSAPPSEPPTGLRARLHRFNNRLPAFLRGYTTPLLGAPATHITSFLILHEITAVLPLFGLFAVFHYSGWTPLPSTGEDNALNEAIQRFGKWMTKKGWVGSEDVEAAKTASATSEDGLKTQVMTQQKGAQLVLQFAAAYVATKALLPIRIVASVWATPWFARVLLSPISRGVKGIFHRKSS